MPPGYGAAQPYFVTEKPLSRMSPMLTRHYPARPATPPAMPTRDGFPTAPLYDDMLDSYYDVKLPVYVVENKV